MSKKILSIVCALFVVLTIIVIGCKKMTSSSDITSQKIPQKVLDKLKTQDGQITIPINETIKGFVTDQNGNPIDVSKSNHRSTDPNLCDDPSNINVTATLVSLSKSFTCNVGYKVNAVWELSTNVDMLLATNPLNSSQLSKGRLQLKNSSGTVIYSQLSITPVSITDLGADPNVSGNKIFRVTYSSANISTSTMNSAYTMANSCFIYTDCTSTGYALNIPYLSNNVFYVGNIYGDPCTRIDKAYIVPDNTAYSNSSGYVSGSDVIGNCYPSGYTHNTGTHVQYRLQGNSTWIDMTWISSPNYGAGANRGPYIYYWEVLPFNISTGTYEFRYRNVMVSSVTVEPPTVTCSGPWSQIETIGIP